MMQKKIWISQFLNLSFRYICADFSEVTDFFVFFRFKTVPVSTLALTFDTSTGTVLFGDLAGDDADNGRGAGVLPGFAILLTGAKIPGKKINK